MPFHLQPGMCDRNCLGPSNNVSTVRGEVCGVQWKQCDSRPNFNQKHPLQLQGAAKWNVELLHLGPAKLKQIKKD